MSLVEALIGLVLVCLVVSFVVFFILGHKQVKTIEQFPQKKYRQLMYLMEKTLEESDRSFPAFLIPPKALKESYRFFPVFLIPPKTIKKIVASENVDKTLFSEVIPAILKWNDLGITLFVYHRKNKDKLKTISIDWEHLERTSVRYKNVISHSSIIDFGTSKIPSSFLFLKDKRSSKNYYLWIFLVSESSGLLPYGHKVLETVWNESQDVPSLSVKNYGKISRSLIFKNLAGLILVLVILGNSLYSGVQLGLSSNPTSVIGADPAGHTLLITYEDDLYYLDAQGTLQETYHLPDFQVQGELIDLQTLSDRSFLVANWQEGIIQNCHLDEQTCQPLPAFTGLTPVTSPFERSFRFVADPDQNLIYVTDTARHGLVILNQDGEVLQTTRGEDPLLCFPNGIRLSNAGNLAIADSNNFQIVIWSRNAEGLDPTPEAEMATVQEPRPQTHCFPEYRQSGRAIALPVAEEKRVIPKFVEQDAQGFWWVLLADHALSRDNLLRFDENWENPRNIQLPAVKPIDHMALVNQQILLSVPEEYQVLSVSTEDLSVTPFGDEAFQNQLDEWRRSREQLTWYYRAGLAISVLGLILITRGLKPQIRREQMADLARLDPSLSPNTPSQN